MAILKESSVNGVLNVTNTTAGTSSGGALQISGGLKTSKASYIGGNLTVNGTVTASTPALSTNNTTVATTAFVKSYIKPISETDYNNLATKDSNTIYIIY